MMKMVRGGVKEQGGGRGGGARKEEGWNRGEADIQRIVGAGREKQRGKQSDQRVTQPLPSKSPPPHGHTAYWEARGSVLQPPPTPLPCSALCLQPEPPTPPNFLQRRTMVGGPSWVGMGPLGEGEF